VKQDFYHEDGNATGATKVLYSSTELCDVTALHVYSLEYLQICHSRVIYELEFCLDTVT
jgi:hypothetical protein